MAENKGKGSQQAAGATPATQAGPDATAAAATPAAKKTRTRKSAAQVQTDTIARTRDAIRKATADLQSSYIKTSGDFAGSPELVEAYKAFDAALVKLGQTAPVAEAQA